MLRKLWLDEGGAVLTTELILLLVITVIGISVGLVVLRDAVVSELQMVASAINVIDPGFGWTDLVYVNATGTSSAVNASLATVTSLGWDVGTGLINNEVVAGGNYEYAGDDSLADLGTGVVVASP
jgi:hypothetical protein